MLNLLSHQYLNPERDVFGVPICRTADHANNRINDTAPRPAALPHADAADPPSPVGTGSNPTEPNPESNTHASFKDDGPFIGVSYLLPMDESSFSFSFAYADMDGKITITNGGDGGGGGTTTGSTTGFSYSASWSKPVSDQTSFVAALNVIRYTYDDTQGLGLDFSADQSFDNISLALRHYF